MEFLLNIVDTTITAWLQQFVPGLPTHLVRLGGIVFCCALVLLLLSIVWIILSRKKPPKRLKHHQILPQSSKNGEIIDVSINGKTLFRGIITQATSRKVKISVTEHCADFHEGGATVTCLFSPCKTETGTITSCECTFLRHIQKKDKTRHVELSTPHSFGTVRRRKHPRKRVVNQQFIRTRLWLEDPQESDTIFEDAQPQININAFTTEATPHDGNSIINISRGGLGLRVNAELIPLDCVEGTIVTINLFMFHFRSKEFRPHWYRGAIRSIEEERGFIRLGIAFKQRGHIDENGSVTW